MDCIDISEGKGDFIIVGCSDGVVRRITNPIFAEFDNTKSYQKLDWKDDPEFQEWKIRQLTHQIGKITRRVKKENSLFEEWEEFEEDEPEWKTQPITACLIAKDNKTFYCSAGGQFAGSLYQCT
mmetsp:Transcript_1958/g.3877  ORF Transcript_1958/g.3877 Transcript_1958/m.3877 type:complete len:124 (+) Transcript_1958:1006-1377(+)